MYKVDFQKKWASFILSFLLIFSLAVSIVPQTVLAESASPYQKIITDESGNQINMAIFPAAPLKIKVAAADVPEVHIAGVIDTLSNVPAFYWSYGCAPTSAAMLFGYYDRTGYSRLKPPPPNAPSNLIATTISSSQINLTWQDNSSDETGFKIERKTGSGSYFQIATVGAGVTSYSNAYLSAGTTYSYRVRAYNAAGNSNYSNEASATTLPPPPPAPTLKSPASGSTVPTLTLRLEWNASSGATDYGLQVATTSSFTTLLVNETGITNLYYDIAPGTLTWNTIYYWRVNARNSFGTSSWSSYRYFKTAIGPPPNAPSNLVATPISSSQIDLIWQDNSTDETGFKIERKTGSGSYFQIATVGAGVTSYSNAYLSASTTYYYRVRAYSAAGNSNYSNEASATTLPPPPSAPTLKSPANASTVPSLTPRLEWNSSTGATDYGLQVATTSCFASLLVNETGITDPYYDIAPGILNWHTTYYWRVNARNSFGSTSSWSRSRYFKTAVGPRLVTLTISSTAGGNVTTPGEGPFTYDEGTVVNLVATPGAGYRFVNWTGNVGTIGNVNAAATNITMNGDYSITANFVKQYDLTISSTAGGTVTTPGVGTFTYDAGTVVSLNATPDAGYGFVNWTGNVGTIGNVNAAATNITMNGDYCVTANFVALYDLTISSTAGGNVTTPGEGTFSYDDGMVVNLVATPDAGYRFDEWTGDVDTIADVDAAATNITMNGNYSITANFVALYDLTISSTAGGNVTTPGEGTFTYDDGTVVDLVATTDANYRFVNWTGDVGTIADVNAAATTIIMNGDYSITANFVVTPMVAAGWYHTVGLKSDGTVVAVGWNDYGQCNVGGWTDIIQVAAGYVHTVGLKSDGTVVAVGWNYAGDCNVGGWTDIIQVAAGYYHTVGLKSDGTLVAVGWNYYGQCNVGGWDLN